MTNIITGEDGNFIENECVLEHNGQKFESNGSYMMKRIDNGLRDALLYHYATKIHNKEGTHIATDHHIGTWDGSVKVHAVLLNTWRNNFGDTRQHFFFIWKDGKKFWGILAGDYTDIVRCHEYKEQD